MTQAEVNRAVARATGETVRTIAQLGFGIADQDLVDHDPEPYDFDPEGKTQDWEAIDRDVSLNLLASELVVR